MNSSEKKLPARAVVYTADIVTITGLKPVSARKLLRKIRNALNKPQRSFVSIQEFCYCTGLEEEFVMEFIK
jgi:hypothetical protein